MDMVIADLKEPRFSAVTEQYYRDEHLQGEVYAGSEAEIVTFEDLSEKAEEVEQADLAVKLTKLVNKSVIEPETVHVTFTVAECGEFHNLGEFHEGIETIEEAIQLYQAIDPSRMNGIPSIGVNMHIEGTEEWKDEQMDILSGKCIDVDFLNYTLELRDTPKVQDALKKLIEAFPEKEVNNRETELLERTDDAKEQKGRISLKERLVEKQNRVSSRQGNIDKDYEKSKNNNKEI